MKLLTILVAVIAVVSTVLADEATEAEYRRMSRRCMSKLGTRVKDVEFLIDHQMPTTRAGKCYLACLYEACGLLKDGEFTEETCREWTEKGGMGREMGDDLYQSCHRAVEDTFDRCDLATKLYRCLRDTYLKN
ncbi:uncharacterized protein [Periplaneta americana]|uniref:uncharacterized protein n=1 Tax=Periplaneta americana TaxID=6978 RepID=UPI0037E72EB9